MITRFDIKGFRTLVDVSVPVAPGITVIVGANNSGKTNFLRAVELMSGAARDKFSQTLTTLGGDESIASEGGDGTLHLSATCVSGKQDATYVLRRGLAWNDDLEFFRDVGGEGRRTMSKSPWAPAWQLESGLPGQQGGRLGSGFARVASAAPAEYAIVRETWERLESARVIDFSLDALREPSKTSQHPTMSVRGEGIAAVLDYLHNEKPDLFDAIVDTVRAAAPEVQRITTPAAVEEGTKTVAIQEQGRVVRAAQMSDGLLLFIGLATVMHMADSTRGLLLVEEPDRGIHPRRIRQFVDQLRVLAQRGTQVVLSTHSPILLDEFRDEPESVLFFDRDATGTHVTRLADKPDWLKDLNGGALGDIWYSGILGGVPAQ